ncbi:CDP-alcohol phosphatidyltransferase family protein [candidate division KSB1 bacterium]|nr:CDP-alcohol phosphatidyltransferase family protein [candidate division KSB1 bacterium]
MKIVILPESLKDGFRKLLQPIINFFIQTNLNPNFFTTISLILSIFSAYQFAKGSLRLAAVILLLAGMFDLIDGSVARESNRVTKFGALYDSTLDRFSEIFIYLGITIHFIPQHEMIRVIDLVVVVTIFLGLGGSLMVSYVRARAEGLGFECKIGIMQRPERLVVLSIGALISEIGLVIAIVLVAIFANITAIQRIWHIWSEDNAEKWKKLPSDVPHE